jgi:hypothetical protein
LNARFGVNGIQNDSRSLGTVVDAGMLRSTVMRGLVPRIPTIWHVRML